MGEDIAENTLGESPVPRTGRKPRGVRFPFGRAADGSAVGIRDYVDGAHVTCFGCDARLVAKRGTRAWHFAHHPDVNRPCNGETALHRLAKVLICEAHRRARLESRPYPLRFNCPGCGAGREVDTRERWTAVQAEHEAIEGVCSDLFFTGVRDFAIEVVVTHDIEEKTRERYSASKLAVFTIHPSWETVGALLEGIDGTAVIGVENKSCGDCAARERAAADREEERKRVEERVERQRHELIRWLDDMAVIPASRASQLLGDWPPARDRFDRDLRAHVRGAIRERAVKLLQIGFEPHKGPWAFKRRLRDTGWAYAALGGKEDRPLWLSQSPTLFLHFAVPMHKLLEFGEPVVRWLGDNGVFVNQEWPQEMRVLGNDRATAIYQSEMYQCLGAPLSEQFAVARRLATIPHWVTDIDA